MNIRDSSIVNDVFNAQKTVDEVRQTSHALVTDKLRLEAQADALVRGFDGIRCHDSNPVWVNE